MLLLFIIR